MRNPSKDSADRNETLAKVHLPTNATNHHLFYLSHFVLFETVFISGFSHVSSIATASPEENGQNYSVFGCFNATACTITPLCYHYKQNTASIQMYNIFG